MRGMWVGRRALVLGLVGVVMGVVHPVLADQGRKKEKEKTMKKNDLPYQEQDEPPEPLFVEYKVGRPFSEPDAERILQDGRSWSYFDYAYVPRNAYYEKVERVRRRWRWDGEVLTQEEMENLKKLAREKFFSLPAEIPMGEGAVIGGTDVYWTVELDGRRHTVHWVQGGDPMPPALEEFDSALRLSIAAAASRWGDQYRSKLKRPSHEK